MIQYYSSQGIDMDEIMDIYDLSEEDEDNEDTEFHFDERDTD